MDQRLVVGVGNIYASESLFRARLAPRGLPAACGRARGRAAGAVDPRGAAGGDRGRRLVACATTSSRTASSATSSAASGSTTGPASPARSARGRSSASSRAPARPTGAAPASAERRAGSGWTARGDWCLTRRAAAVALCVAAQPVLLAARADGAPTGSPMALRDHPGRAARPGRPRHAQPAQGAQRAQRPADRRARGRAERFRRGRRGRGHGRHRLGQGVRRRCRHQGDAGEGLRRGRCQRLHRPLAEDRRSTASRSSPRSPATRWAAAASWR